MAVSLPQEVCHDVCSEPHLQQLSGEVLNGRTSIRGDDARLDVSACGFWGGRFERAFFDVRVFNPNAPTNRAQSLQATYRKHEQEKRRQYGERVREVERASFSPLIFSSSGGMGPAASSVYKRLASLISDKRCQQYSVTMGWLRTVLCFALLRSAIMCLRGNRVSRTPLPASNFPTDLVVYESLTHLPS